MTDETSTENPLDAIRTRADELGLTDDERDDFIEKRMARAGFNKGPGEWIPAGAEDDTPKDDDDEPVTRGEYRRIQRENKRKSVATPPPKKGTESGNGAAKKPASRDPWW